MPAKPSIWTYLTIGVSCLLLGFAISSMAYRYRLLRVPGGPIFERMNRELGLSPEQRQKIESIMHDTHTKAMEMRREAQEQRHKLFVQSFGKVRDVLTPEQQAKFDRDFTQPWRRRGGRDRDYGPPDDGGEQAGPPPGEAPTPPH